MSDATRLPSPLEAWTRSDLARALLPADRDAVEATAGIRALVVDLARAAGPDEELYDACAVLGRMLAAHGSSPTLASATIEHAAAALGAPSASWVAPARAALAEGFAAAVVESAQRAALRSWEYPSCVVPLGEAAVAVAAGYPSDDEEALAGWASRVARGAAVAGIRRAVVAGSDRGCAAVLEAFQFVGIEAQRAPAMKRS